MNNLSLLIYFAGTVGNIVTLLSLVTFLLLVATIGSIIGWFIYHDETDSFFRRYQGDDLVECRETRELWRKRALKFAVLAFSIGIINGFTPNRSTVLLITASEMGEKVLNHPNIEQIMDPSVDLITTWMKNETTEIKKRMEGVK